MKKQIKHPENISDTCYYNFNPKNLVRYYSGTENENNRVIPDKSEQNLHPDENSIILAKELCRSEKLLAEFKKNNFDTDIFKVFLKADYEFFTSNPKELCKINTELNKFLKQKSFDLPYLLRYTLHVIDRALAKYKEKCKKQDSAILTMNKVKAKETRLHLKKYTLKDQPLHMDSLPNQDIQNRMFSLAEIFKEIYNLEQSGKYKHKSRAYANIFRKFNITEKQSPAIIKKYDRWKQTDDGIIFANTLHRDRWFKEIALDDEKSQKDGTVWWRSLKNIFP
jgi:hypothetical protein